jgi:MoaA/NifB/PqqE/SkfB family radical SAM enzyme
VLDIGKRRLNRLTHHLHTMPILVLMPHSRCNCRCVMCDIWKANESKHELTRAELAEHLESIRHLHVRQVVLSGGEALMHFNLWTLCALLKELPASITLLSTGLLLQRHAPDIIRWTDEVIVSLDGSEPVHNQIRNVPHAYARLAQGVSVLKSLAPDYRVTARSTLQRGNFFDLPNIIRAAHQIGLDGISFLAADVSSAAFNRAKPWDTPHISEVALTSEEVAQFAIIVEQTIRDFASDFASHYIAESPTKLRRLVQYFAALDGQTESAGFPPHTCNAPWVSTVVEADGTVRPCFFHQPYGNIHQASLTEILNSDQAISFRRHLDVGTNPTCVKCVCTLNLPAHASFHVRIPAQPASEGEGAKDDE